MNSGIPDFLSNQTVTGTMLLDRGAYWTPEEILADFRLFGAYQESDLP